MVNQAPPPREEALRIGCQGFAVCSPRGAPASPTAPCSFIPLPCRLLGCLPPRALCFPTLAARRRRCDFSQPPLQRSKPESGVLGPASEQRESRQDTAQPGGRCPGRWSWPGPGCPGSGPVAVEAGGHLISSLLRGVTWARCGCRASR